MGAFDYVASFDFLVHANSRVLCFMFYVLFQPLRISLQDSLLDAAKVPRAELHLVHQQLAPLDVKPLHVVRVVVWVEPTAVHGQNVTLFRHGGSRADCPCSSCKVKVQTT